MAGNRNSGRKANERVFRQALLNNLDSMDGSKDRKKIHRIAKTLVDLAVGGDLQAIREVMDRVDGKPKQEADMNHNLKGSLNIVTKYVEPDG